MAGITFLGWAQEATDPDGLTKVDIPPEMQLTGLKKTQPMGRQYFNKLFHYLLQNTVGGKTTEPTNGVRIFTVEQPDLVANGWALVKEEAVTASSGGTAPASGKFYYYEHTGV